jgi:dipeptidase E
MRRILLLSSSTVHGFGYLQHAKNDIQQFFAAAGVTKLLFVPYAKANHDEYAQTARSFFETIGISVDSLHTFSDPVAAVREARGIFIGGGNTFRLLRTLYALKLVPVIRERVLLGDLAYMGSSAGTNVAGPTIRTTNDMPIVEVPTLDAMRLINLQLNPHFIEKVEGAQHMGESRETRIREFQEENPQTAVLGLREPAMILVEGNKARIVGASGAVLFETGKPMQTIAPDSDISHLI